MSKRSWLAALAIVVVLGGLGWWGSRLAALAPRGARALALPAGDAEVAWVGTATAYGSWERFVSGARRAASDEPGLGLGVDDSAAFPADTTAPAEVVLTRAGFAGALRVRWYKTSAAAGAPEWAAALARRDPAPLAVVSAASSDRASDLAAALRERGDGWAGVRPLLLLTGATAVRVADPAAPDDGGPDGGQVGLLRVYAGRTLRLCVTNPVMAEAVLDFVAHGPRRDELEPRRGPMCLASAVGAPDAFAALARLLTARQAVIFGLQWDDDPYSRDQFRAFQERMSVLDRGRPATGWFGRARPPSDVDFQVNVGSSVGGLTRANPWEARAAQRLLERLPRSPRQRSLLVLPAVASPARRVLTALTAAAPGVGERLVAVTGDSLTLNTVYRDAEFAWDMRSIRVPVVFYAHADPTRWTAAEAERPGLPSATDELVRQAELVGLLARGAFDADTRAVRGSRPGLSAEHLDPSGEVFAPDGERRETGGVVVYLRPGPESGGRGRVSVYGRQPGEGWVLVREPAWPAPREAGEGP